MMIARIAINGLGRIGRAFLKMALKRPELEVVAVNDISDPENLAYLMRYDSIYGRYAVPTKVERREDGTFLAIGERRIWYFQEADPRKLPWEPLDIDVVVEATGAFDSYAGARGHLTAGARRVVLTAPATDADTIDARTILVGINTNDLGRTRISSNGSCTTNSASPIIQIVSEAVGIQKAILHTVHGYTATQRLVDGPVRGHDMRRGRAAALNLIPATTGAAVAVTRAIPDLTNRFDGTAIRVPVPTGSLSTIVMLTERHTTVEGINEILEAAADQDRWRRVFATTRDPLVSSDIVGDPHGAIADLSLTTVVDGNLCAVYSWYDNEFGFTHTLLEHVLEAAAISVRNEMVPG